MISKSITSIFFMVIIRCAWTYVEIVTYIQDNHVPINLFENDMYFSNNELNVYVKDKVKVQVYYECLCPDCREFDTGEFKKAVMLLGDYLDIRTYPYGNAKTIKSKDGKIEFKCQHGPAECYGNKLHGCALDIIQNKTTALFFNTCMMENIQSNRGSDDIAADKCAYMMGLNASPIKSCAKGDRGTELLNYYGQESAKVGYQYVPYILVNGKESDAESFIKHICDAFHSPPPQCLKN